MRSALSTFFYVVFMRLVVRVVALVNKSSDLYLDVTTSN